MTDNDKDMGKPDDLDESPEARMENFPKRKASMNETGTGGPPGKPRPASADATGEGDADDLAENTDSATFHIRQEEAQRGRRAKESRREP